MPNLCAITHGPEQCEKMQKICSHLKRQNTIYYTDHTEWQFWIDSIEQGKALAPQLREAEIMKCWMTR